MLTPVCRADSAQPRLISIAAVRSAEISTSSEVAIRGSVTHMGREFFIQDSTGAIRLRSDDMHSRLALGDEIEATGTPMRDGSPELRVHSIRRLWGGSTPLPVALDPDRAADGNASGMLVQLDARLVSEPRISGGEVQLVLQGGSQTFAATLPSNEAPSSLGLPTWPVNSQLRLTGVIVLNADAPALADAPFQLLLRSAQDVEVLRSPPWWNLEHATWLLLGLGIVVLMAFALWQHLRALRLRAVLEERSRIARDIHDTLAQGFAGITLQLESADHLLGGQQLPAAKDALRMALQMVRRSRADSHTSIRVLRSLSREESLHGLFEASLAEFATHDLHITSTTQGTPFETPYEVTNHLFHIGMEAFTNSVQHARAKQVALTTVYAADAVTVSVRDDGCGFDPEQTRGTLQGHFGLDGMRERAAAIGAVLSVCSLRGHGTTVQVVAPRRSTV